MSRLLKLFGFAVLLLAVAHASPRPSGTGPAGPQVDRGPYMGVWTHRPVRFIGLGDSITAGYNSDKHHSYFNLLAENGPDENPQMAGISLYGVFPALRPENRAVSGSTSWQHLKQVANLPASDASTLGWVVITSGANDLIYRYRDGPGDGALNGATLAQAQPWIASYGRRLDKMVDEIQAKFPGGSQIFIATIYDPTDGVGDIEKSIDPLVRPILNIKARPDAEAVLAAYNAEIARVARRKGEHLVDVHQLFLGHGIHCANKKLSSYCAEDPTFWYLNDVQHPNQRGHDAIRREFLNVMAGARKDVK